LSVPLAMQPHNTVLHDYISVSCSCIILPDDKYLQLKMLKFAKY